MNEARFKKRELEAIVKNTQRWWAIISGLSTIKVQKAKLEYFNTF